MTTDIYMPVNFLELPEPLQRSLYTLANGTHDAGAECMRNWVIMKLTKLRKEMGPDGLLGKLDQRRAADSDNLLKMICDRLNEPGAGMHEHAPFEAFMKDMTSGVYEPIVKPKEPSDEETPPAEAVTAKYIMRPLKGQH